MCGIIGIASNKSVTANIIQSLKKLEYRGYDSSGIATIVDGNIDEKKCAGRVENLEKILLTIIKVKRRLDMEILITGILVKSLPWRVVQWKCHDFIKISIGIL